MIFRQEKITPSESSRKRAFSFAGGLTGENEKKYFSEKILYDRDTKNEMSYSEPFHPIDK